MWLVTHPIKSLKSILYPDHLTQEVTFLFLNKSMFYVKFFFFLCLMLLFFHHRLSPLFYLPPLPIPTPSNQHTMWISHPEYAVRYILFWKAFPGLAETFIIKFNRHKNSHIFLFEYLSSWRDWAFITYCHILTITKTK